MTNNILIVVMAICVMAAVFTRCYVYIIEAQSIYKCATQPQTVTVRE